MLKRTKGYLLLTLLVLTGLAGRMHTETLTARERHTVIRELKTAKASFLHSTATLSKKQLKYRPKGWNMNLEECIRQHAAIQEKLWMLNRKALKNDDEESPNLNEQGLQKLIKEPVQLASCLGDTYDNKENYETLNAEMLRFLRTTTENVRAHRIILLNEKLDAYQLLQLSAACTRNYCRLIDDARSSSRFPD